MYHIYATAMLRQFYVLAVLHLAASAGRTDEILLHLAAAAGSIDAAAGSTDEMPHLGLGFYMPDTSTYSYSPNAGISVFKDLSYDCFKKQPMSTNRAEFLFFSSPSLFYRYLGQDLGLKDYEVLPHNFYRTLLDVSQSISTDLEVTGAGIEISREVYGYQLDPDCMQDVRLDDTLLEDFKKLEDEIVDPSLHTSWAVYDAFMRKYGTHYIKASYYGNKILNFVFAETSSGYTEKQIGASTCAKLKNANLTFCTEYTDTDYNNAASNTAEFYEVRGGSEAARNRITVGEPTSAEIYEFVKSETDNQETIRIKLEPLTALLKRRFVETSQFVKVLNMQQYYEGFVAQGCITKYVNGVLTRRFVLASLQYSVPEYKCELARTGCRHDADCNLLASSFWTHCYCYGKTCITSTRVNSVQFGSYISRAALTSPVGSYYEGENPSCYYAVGPICYCDQDDVGKWDQIWPNDRSDLTHDLEMYRQFYKNFGPLDNNVNGLKVSGFSLILPIVLLPIARQIFV